MFDFLRSRFASSPASSTRPSSSASGYCSPPPPPRQGGENKSARKAWPASFVTSERAKESVEQQEEKESSSGSSKLSSTDLLSSFPSISNQAPRDTPSGVPNQNFLPGVEQVDASRAVFPLSVRGPSVQERPQCPAIRGQSKEQGHEPLEADAARRQLLRRLHLQNQDLLRQELAATKATGPLPSSAESVPRVSSQKYPGSYYPHEASIVAGPHTREGTFSCHSSPSFSSPVFLPQQSRAPNLQALAGFAAGNSQVDVSRVTHSSCVAGKTRFVIPHAAVSGPRGQSAPPPPAPTAHPSLRPPSAPHSSRAGGRSASAHEFPDRSIRSLRKDSGPDNVRFCSTALQEPARPRGPSPPGSRPTLSLSEGGDAGNPLRHPAREPVRLLQGFASSPVPTSASGRSLNDSSQGHGLVSSQVLASRRGSSSSHFGSLSEAHSASVSPVYVHPSLSRCSPEVYVVASVVAPAAPSNGQPARPSPAETSLGGVAQNLTPKQLSDHNALGAQALRQSELSGPSTRDPSAFLQLPTSQSTEKPRLSSSRATPDSPVGALRSPATAAPPVLPLSCPATLSGPTASQLPPGRRASLSQSRVSQVACGGGGEVWRLPAGCPRPPSSDRTPVILGAIGTDSSSGEENRQSYVGGGNFGSISPPAYASQGAPAPVLRSAAAGAALGEALLGSHGVGRPLSLSQLDPRAPSVSTGDRPSSTDKLFLSANEASTARRLVSSEIDQSGRVPVHAGLESSLRVCSPSSLANRRRSPSPSPQHLWRPSSPPPSLLSCPVAVLQPDFLPLPSSVQIRVKEKPASVLPKTGVQQTRVVPQQLLETPATVLTQESLQGSGNPVGEQTRAECLIPLDSSLRTKGVEANPAAFSEQHSLGPIETEHPQAPVSSRLHKPANTSLEDQTAPSSAFGGSPLGDERRQLSLELETPGSDTALLYWPESTSRISLDPGVLLSSQVPSLSSVNVRAPSGVAGGQHTTLQTRGRNIPAAPPSTSVSASSPLRLGPKRQRGKKEELRKEEPLGSSAPGPRLQPSVLVDSPAVVFSSRRRRSSCSGVSAKQGSEEVEPNSRCEGGRAFSSSEKEVETVGRVLFTFRLEHRYRVWYLSRYARLQLRWSLKDLDAFLLSQDLGVRPDAWQGMRPTWTNLPARCC